MGGIKRIVADTCERSVDEVTIITSESPGAPPIGQRSTRCPAYRERSPVSEASPDRSLAVSGNVFDYTMRTTRSRSPIGTPRVHPVQAPGVSAEPRGTNRT